MDAISKELEAWNLTFLMALATLINLMLKKYFSVLVDTRIVNVICKLLNIETDKTATLMNAFHLKCCILICYNSDFLSHSNLVSHFKGERKNNLIMKLDLMECLLRKQSRLLMSTLGFITWQNILDNHSQWEVIMSKLK